VPRGTPVMSATWCAVNPHTSISVTAIRWASGSVISMASPSPTSPDRDTGQDQAIPSPTSAPATLGPSGAAAGPEGDTDSGHGEASTSEVPSASSSPGSGHDPGTGHENGRAAAATEAQEHSELLFGINLESAVLVAAAVAVSVLFAAAMVTLGMPWLAGTIAAAMLAFTALDIREVIFQAGRSHPGLAALAAAVAALHLLAALAAAHVARIGAAHHQGTARQSPR
jgi:hypothetical protein